MKLVHSAIDQVTSRFSRKVVQDLLGANQVDVVSLLNIHLHGGLQEVIG
jgi:hypothetical protein